MYFARCCMLDLWPLEWCVALVSHMTSGEVSVTDMFQHHRLEEAHFLLYDTVHPQCSVRHCAPTMSCTTLCTHNVLYDTVHPQCSVWHCASTMFCTTLCTHNVLRWNIKARQLGESGSQVQEECWERSSVVTAQQPHSDDGDAGGEAG